MISDLPSSLKCLVTFYYCQTVLEQSVIQFVLRAISRKSLLLYDLFNLNFPTIFFSVLLGLRSKEGNINMVLHI